MERTKLGPAEQFCDYSGAWHVGRRVTNYGGCELRTSDFARQIAFRLHDTGEIVLVEASRLEPNVPTTPLPADDELAKAPAHGD